MFYQRTSSSNTFVIPQQLLRLFEYYSNEIINTEITLEINESSKEYIIKNKILNAKKTQKHLQKRYSHIWIRQI